MTEHFSSLAQHIPGLVPAVPACFDNSNLLSQNRMQAVPRQVFYPSNAGPGWGLFTFGVGI